jgi:hypothetical protein
MDRGAVATLPGTRSLYERVMGDAWFHLAAPIRELHTTRPETRAHGRLRLEHGAGRMVGFIARTLQLPRPGVGIDTRLFVTTVEKCEHWRRAFGRVLVETHQSSCDGDLVERYGVLEFRFGLHAFDERLVYRQREARLRLLSLRLRLPRYVAPQIEAREEAIAPGRVKIAVSVTLPGLGLLIAYDGTIAVGEAGP